MAVSGHGTAIPARARRMPFDVADRTLQPDLLLLMDFIARVADTSEAGHQTKTCMLRTLRYLTKSPLPFDSIKKEKNFYSKYGMFACRKERCGWY